MKLQTTLYLFMLLWAYYTHFLTKVDVKKHYICKKTLLDQQKMCGPLWDGSAGLLFRTAVLL